MNNRINSWIFKFFSKGEKEVIIKSVVTALPNHVMSFYRLPKATVKKLTSAVAQFWWSPRGTQEACTRSHGKKYTQIKTNEVWVLKT